MSIRHFTPRLVPVFLVAAFAFGSAQTRAADFDNFTALLPSGTPAPLVSPSFDRENGTWPAVFQPLLAGTVIHAAGGDSVVFARDNLYQEDYVKTFYLEFDVRGTGSITRVAQNWGYDSPTPPGMPKGGKLISESLIQGHYALVWEINRQPDWEWFKYTVQGGDVHLSNIQMNSECIPVPEPESLALALAGLGVAVVMRQRRRPVMPVVA